MRQSIAALSLRTVLQRLVNDLPDVFEFVPDQLQPRRADARVAHATFRLNKFDKLDEVWHGVHPKQQKPPIQLKRLLALPVHAKVEQIDRLPGQRVGESGDPARGTHSDGF